MLRHRKSRELATLICLLAGLFAHQQTMAQVFRQRLVQELTGPTIPQLASEQLDLTYDELIKILPGTPVSDAALGFDPTKARYFDLVRKELELTDNEVEVFRRRGFVSVDHGRAYTFTTAYYDVYASELPVLITSDSILHALHKSYDNMLRELETTWFAWTVDEVLAEVHIALAAEAYRTQGLSENFRDVDLYVTVARNLLAGAGAATRQSGNSYVPPQAGWNGKLAVHSALGQDDEVTARLKDIQSLRLPDAMGGEPPTEIYGGTRFVDFSQFRPRGHYTKSVQLQNYFRCMMWLGRADTGWNVLPTDATPGVESDDKRELRNAMLFVHLIQRTGNLERLRAVDRLISFLVGGSDALNPFRLDDLMKQAAIRRIADLAELSRVEQLQEEIRQSRAARQLIRSQIMISDPYDLTKVPPPATYQTFGQRFAIDSYVLSQVVFDAVIFNDEKQKRMMPSGLDVMAALGNDAAVPLLQGELRQWNYSANLLAGRRFIEQQGPGFWDSNLYSRWLNCLRNLDSDFTGQPHAPQVMRTPAWRMKQLQTQLASWSQLRHDTVLYAKQSFTAVPGCEYLCGYVEPYPEFYAEVKAFALKAREMIEASPYRSLVQTRNAALTKIRTRHLDFFETMASHLGQLETLARKELAGESFSTSERQFVARTINSRGMARYGSGGRPTYDGWYTQLLYQVDQNATDVAWEATIADVHTDPASKRVLQVGVGDLNLCVIAIDRQNERVVFVGPVFSYYEFQQPAEERLTDAEWAARLRTDERPSRPTWVSSFVAPSNRRPKYGSSVQFRRNGDTLIVSVQRHTKSGVESGRNTVHLSDEGLRSLAGLSDCRTLDLSRSQITDAGLVYLRSLNNLRSLNLSSTLVEGPGLESLTEAAWLRALNLRNTQVSDAALKHLARLPHVESLDLSGTRITNGCVEHLRKMSNLRELKVQRTQVDDAGIEQLRQALPNCSIGR